MKRKVYPLSISQKDVVLPTFFLSRKARDMNNLGFFFTVKENPNILAMEKAFNHLLKMNSTFRLKCYFTLKGIREYVDDYSYYSIPVINLDDSSILIEEMNKHRHIKGIFMNKKLFKAIIFTYDDKASLFICVHHICFDGYSINLANKNLAEYYDLYANGKEPEDKISKYSIEQYLSEDKTYRKSKKHVDDILFWRKKLIHVKILVYLCR